jgi:large subunit ribosomal protein L21
MQAIIETGGKQYRVAPGDVIRVEKLAGEAGTEVELKPLAIFRDEGDLLAGADLGAARVKATIVAEGRGDKVIVFKFKRKKQYKRTYGHRQNYTELTINQVLV